MERSVSIIVPCLGAQILLNLLPVLAVLFDLIKKNLFDITGELLEDCNMKQREAFIIKHLHQVHSAHQIVGVLAEIVNKLACTLSSDKLYQRLNNLLILVFL